MQMPQSARVREPQTGRISRPAGGRLLTPEQVRQIRHLYYQSGCTASWIAVQFGVSRPLVQAIVKRLVYKDVTDEPGPDETESETESEEDPEEEAPMSEVISLNTHPSRGRLSAEELEALIVESVPCTLCQAPRRTPCRVYQGPKHPDRKSHVGEEHAPHMRRITLARRRGIL